jgi:hypothetical protein
VSPAGASSSAPRSSVRPGIRHARGLLPPSAASAAAAAALGGGGGRGGAFGSLLVLRGGAGSGLALRLLALFRLGGSGRGGRVRSVGDLGSRAVGVLRALARGASAAPTSPASPSTPAPAVGVRRGRLGGCDRAGGCRLLAARTVFGGGVDVFHRAPFAHREGAWPASTDERRRHMAGRCSVWAPALRWDPRAGPRAALRTRSVPRPALAFRGGGAPVGPARPRPRASSFSSPLWATRCRPGGHIYRAGYQRPGSAPARHPHLPAAMPDPARRRWSSPTERADGPDGLATSHHAQDTGVPPLNRAHA